MATAPVSPIVLVRGAGEMASAIAWRLHRAQVTRIVMTELDHPLCVRRLVAFSTAIDDGHVAVEGVEAVAVRDRAGIDAAWRERRIAVVRLGDWARIDGLAPEIVIDAILAKFNTGTRLTDAPQVIALGPGFTAGIDCHLAIETNRGHDLGRIIERGATAPNTGVPGDIAGHTAARVFRAPADGMFESARRIGEVVTAGEELGRIDGQPVIAGLDGILRGLICPGTLVTAGLKLGDIDPRAKLAYCATISDKARAIAGAVLEGVLRHANRPR